MKAISLHQPFATLSACRIKIHETRSKSTNYRGPLVIQAAQRWDAPVIERCAKFSAMFSERFDAFPHPSDAQRPGTWDLGCYVAVVDLVATFQVASADVIDHPWIMVQATDGTEHRVGVDDFACGDWKPGRWAWVMQNARRLPRPIFTRGYQWLWKPTRTERRKLAEQVQL